MNSEYRQNFTKNLMTTAILLRGIAVSVSLAQRVSQDLFNCLIIIFNIEDKFIALPLLKYQIK
ncbi:hypothetical protein Sgly_1321 [Syntrophobotulus glycolicus DSM 8271]|uniref:Uncharacterized protein n=1 Tax=Syntrophobotulus glycolicus (strain DSM 8271 / FlGlyR) TaxID=645991 RepID=F0SVS2_SYNGF|nr:hypothetical protein Sgly_1321 [Syntrophobotulus glycolicus DSM 8271]